MYFGLLFNRPTGRVYRLNASNKLIGLTNFANEYGNVSHLRDYIIFDHTGFVWGYYEGHKKDLPVLCLGATGMHIWEFITDINKALDDILLKGGKVYDSF